MSQVFRCDECGVRTTEPFLIKGATLCAVCADGVDHRAVDRREAEFVRKYTQDRRYMRASPTIHRNFR